MRIVERGLAVGVSGALVATLVVVVVPAPAAADPAGMLSGTITSAGDGAPIAGACVAVLNPSDGREFARPCTGSDGRYRVDGLPENLQVKIRAIADRFAEQWAPDEPDARNARVLTLTTAPTAANFVLRTAVGSLVGRIIDPEGRGAGTARVTLRNGDYDATGEALTDGTYRFANLPPGDYAVTLSRPDLASVTGLTVHIVAGAETVGTFVFVTRLRDPDPTGFLSGRITDGPGGSGIPGARVVLFSQLFTEMAVTTTDSAGRYGFDDLPDRRTFKMRAAAPGFADTWAINKPDFANGETMRVGAAHDINLALHRGAGTLRGRITDPSGNPVGLASIRIAPATGGRSARTWSRVDGTYEQVNLQPDAYKVSVSAIVLGSQWARGRDLEADADLVSVTDGSVTTLDEQFRPRGRVEVTLVDAVTGAPVSTNCVFINSTGLTTPSCAGQSGVYVFPDIAPGVVSVTARADGAHLGAHREPVRLRSGQTIRITLPLRPAGMITTTVRRVADGSIPRTCAYVVPTALAAPWSIETGSPTGGCNTDSQGNTIETITIGPVAAIPVQLFMGGHGTHGAQWLGANGGTGDRRNAAVIQVRAGATVMAPQVRLDPAGSISGVVRDSATGAPLQFAVVRPFGQVTGLETACSNLPWSTACADQNGRYRLDGLGPYAWPIEFVAAGHASTWSGGAADRFHATMIPVRSGQVTALDAALGKDATFTDFRFGLTPPQYWAVTAYHAVTGDLAGSAVYHAPTLGGLNTGPVVLQYQDYTPGVPPCWYTGARAVREAKVINVTAVQTIAGIKLAPGNTCAAVPGAGPPPPPVYRAHDAVPAPAPDAPGAVGVRGAAPTSVAPPLRLIRRIGYLLRYWHPV